ncbi:MULTISPECIES: hypothetical protein [unclassified Psychrobacillus]|uniref:hypothetical protein n=1 Tax=unclassified Psychrobacillus TaxID=2636677 RepID=UPI0030F6C0B3
MLRKALYLIMAMCVFGSVMGTTASASNTVGSTNEINEKNLIETNAEITRIWKTGVAKTTNGGQAPPLTIWFTQSGFGGHLTQYDKKTFPGYSVAYYEGYLYNMNNPIPLPTVVKPENLLLLDEAMNAQADTMTYAVTLKKLDVVEFPQTLWKEVNGYAGYLTLATLEYNRDGYWYGVYKGTLRKGPYGSNQIEEEK